MTKLLLLGLLLVSAGVAFHHPRTPSVDKGTQKDTVAVVLGPDGPVLIVPTEVAQAEYDVLNNNALQFKEDEKLLHALASALNPMLKPPLGKMPDGRTRAEHFIERWKQP